MVSYLDKYETSKGDVGPMEHRDQWNSGFISYP